MDSAFPGAVFSSERNVFLPLPHGAVFSRNPQRFAASAVLRIYASYAHIRIGAECADAHYAPLRIVCAEYASAHNIRRMRICALNAHYRAYALMRIICAHAHVRIICARILCLRSCRLRSRRLSSCPHCYSGGGGSCRRQGKSAAPAGRRGERVGRDGRVSPVSLQHSEKETGEGGG